MNVFVTLLLILASCHTNKLNNINQLTDQEGDIQVQTCSRGCYQFILQPTGATNQRFYVTNFPDSLTTFALDAHNKQTNLHVLFSGKLSGNKQLITSAGPDDRPTPLYELPSFQLERIRRLPAKPKN